MKYLFAILFLLPTLALADRCEAFGDLAASIMKSRQIGVEMSKVMRDVDFDENKLIVVRAYEVERCKTETCRLEKISEFRNRYELKCYSNKVRD